MAVGMLLAGEGFTRDMYVQLTEKMFGEYPMSPEKAPEGCIIHTAGQSEHGWYVYDVWESEEHFLRFTTEQIGPAIHELTGAEGGGPEPQFYEIETLVKMP